MSEPESRTPAGDPVERAVATEPETPVTRPTRAQNRFVRRLRIAGVLAAAGLVVQVLTLFDAHPFTFFTFLIGGIGLVAAAFVALVWAWLIP